MRASRFALDTRIATVALALVLAMVSIPIVTCSVAVDSHCAITMDICHPTQAADIGNAALFAPAPQTFMLACVSHDSVGALDDFYQPIAGRLGEAPDSPPPKLCA